MNIDQVIGLIAGIAVAFLVLLPLCLFIIWISRRSRSELVAKSESLQERLEEEKARAAELTELVVDLNQKHDALRAERDTWLKKYVSLEKSKAHWKSHYDAIFGKHNDLVRLHNDLVRKYNIHLKIAKKQAVEHRSEAQEADQRYQNLQSQVQEVQQRLSETLQDKQKVFLECQELQQRIESAESNREQLTQKLSEAAERERQLAAKSALGGEERALLQQQITALLGELDDLRNKLDARAQGNSDLTRQIIRFHRELNELEQKNHELEQQLIRLGQTNAKFTLDLEISRQQLLFLEQEKQKASIENEGLVQKNREMSSQIDCLHRKNQALETETGGLCQENADLAQKIQELDRCLHLALAGLSAGYGELDTDSAGAQSQLDLPTGSGERPFIFPRWQDTRPVVIGLDFGTYSTKVVVRIRGEKKSSVLVFDEPAAGYPSFVSPSLVRLIDGRLFFGRLASQKTGGTPFRSLKVSLLPPTSTDGWQQESFPVGTPPDLLVAFYLTWVLGKLKAILGGENTPQVSLNVAAPMDHLENDAMKERYLHVVHAAWQATFGPYPVRVEQGAELEKLRPLFEYWLERAFPDLTVRRFEVLPETLAPLVSLSQDPRVRPGLYMMVDMGAGTTEFSISHVNELDADHRILCYADTSILLGGNQFNENDLINAGKDELRLEEVRLRKKLLGKLDSVWYTGFSKDKDGGPALKNRWKQLNVLLSGGGLRRKNLQTAIEQKPPMKSIFGNDEMDYQVSWHHPADLEFLGSLPGNSADDLRSSLAYFAVAHGLSLERQKWPKWHPPGDVENSDGDVKIDNPLEFGYLEW